MFILIHNLHSSEVASIYFHIVSHVSQTSGKVTARLQTERTMATGFFTYKTHCVNPYTVSVILIQTQVLACRMTKSCLLYKLQFREMYQVR